jgi:hypothetical protein
MTVETVAEILASIDDGRFCHANVEIGLAITAYQQRPCEDALRVVILARTPEIEHSQRQLDFLTALPEAAWPTGCRDETLASMSRSIGWRMICV